MENVAILAIVGGFLGVLASAVASWVNVWRKKNVVIKVAGVEITLTLDPKDTSSEQSKQIIELLEAVERKRIPPERMARAAMADRPRLDRARNARISNAAGLSAGTSFSGVVLLLPDGLTKSLLLILSPAITIAISNLWHVVTQETDAWVADWRIRSQKRKAANLYQNLISDRSANPQLVEKAKQNLDALTLIEVEITKRRVEAIVAS